VSWRPSFPIALALLFALLLTDLLLKAWAAQNLVNTPVRPLIPGLLSLTYTLNPGIAWGLLSGLTVPLAVLRLAVGLGLILTLWRGRPHPKLALSLALIAAGALGNAVDGLTRGSVVDYLSSPLLDRFSQRLSAQPFPVFNLADVLVLLGVAALLLASARRTPTPPTALTQTQPKGES